MPLHLTTVHSTEDGCGGVVVAGLDRGPANAIDLDLVAELDAALDGVGPTQALVLTGRDGMFTGGLDLDVLRAGGERATELTSAMGRLLLRVLQSPRPIVVAADGHAVAAGAMLMLAADLAFVSDRPARFGFAEVANGLPLPTGAIELITARANPAVTLLLAAHAHLAGPEEAVSLGLANEVVASDQLLSVAVEHAARLAALPADAYALTKRRVTAGLVERMRSADA